MKRNRLVAVVFVLALLLSLRSLFMIIFTFAPDFSVFYTSARNLMAFRDIYTDNTLYTGFGYPPNTLIPFIPLSFLPYQWAQAVWVLASYLSLFGAVVLSARLFGMKTMRQWMMVWIFAVLSFPAKFTLGMGQVNIVALFLLLMFLTAHGEKKVFLMQSAALLLLLLKPHFMILLVLLLLIRPDLMIVLPFITYLGSLICFILIFGPGQLQTYLTHTVPPLLVFTGRGIYYNQGIGAFLSRLLPDATAKDGFIVLAAVIMIAVLAVLKRRTLPMRIHMTVLIPVFLMIEPLSWQHHYVFLLPVFVWLWAAMPKGYSAEKMLLGLSYLLISVNIRNPQTVGLLPAGQLILSHVFVGNALLLFLALRNVSTLKGKV